MSSALRRGPFSERSAHLNTDALLEMAASLGTAASSKMNASLSARVLAMTVFFTGIVFSKAANLGKDVKRLRQSSAEAQKLAVSSQ